MPAQPSRNLPTRPLLLGAAALVVLLVAALLAPRGGDPDDGSLAPATDAGSGTLTDRDRAEIERVLAEAPGDVRARTTPSALAAGLLRCAEFEDQRYCLGTGWTSATEREVVERAVSEASATRARAAAAETTGDLTTADLLRQRAAMTPEELEATERTELEQAARDVEKVVTLRHELLGEPLPAGFTTRHPAARVTTRSKGIADYPQRDTVMDPRRVRSQTRTYWCGPATMQMIAWGWQDRRRTQSHWADQLGTTTSGSAVSEMVRVTNKATGYDRADRAGSYVVLDVSDWKFKQWMLLQMRHVHDYRAPLILHPVLVKRFYPYLDDDASGHFQVGRGYDKNGRKPGTIGYFEPWNQQRFDPSEPYIARVQWRRAYNSFRANKAHPQQNIGV